MDIVKPIKVGNNVYLGYEAVVLPGVTIGNNVVIGARLVVTKNVPSNSVAVGIIARVIKTIEEYKKKTLSEGENTKMLARDLKDKFYSQKFNR